MPEDFGYLVFLSFFLFATSQMFTQWLYLGLSRRIARLEHREGNENI